MLSVVKLNANMLSVVMLNVIMLSVVMLNVIAPCKECRNSEIENLPKYFSKRVVPSSLFPSLLRAQNKLDHSYKSFFALNSCFFNYPRLVDINFLLSLTVVLVRPIE